VTRERNRRTIRVTPEKSPAPETWTLPEGLFAAPDGAGALPQLFMRPSVIAAPRVRVATPLVALPRLRALPRLAPIPPVIVRPIRDRDARAVVQFLEL
jgi:hypothetical protein